MINGRNPLVFLCFLFFVSLLTASDVLQFCVINQSEKSAYNKILCYPLTINLEYSPKVTELSKGEIVEVPSQYDIQTKSLLFILLGLTKPGETRIFQIDTGKKSKANTDLKVEETKEIIRISNTYFTVEHNKIGGGGFPSTIYFNISGNRERFLFEDRLYEKNRGYFTLRSDPKSTAKVIANGPLEVVVETKARYYENGRYAPGNARATYIYTYRAYSPFIEVSAKVEKDDNFVWSELHFLQISRKDKVFPFWAGGEPFQKGEFTDSHQGRVLPKWAVMFNREDAVGLYSKKNISLYDGLDYYNYIQEMVSSFGERVGEFHAWIYIGPYSDSISQTFADISKKVKMEIQPLTITTNPYKQPKYELENEILKIGFASEEDKMGVVSLVNKVTGENFLQVLSEEQPLIWRLVLSRGGRDNIAIDNTTPSQQSVQKIRTKSGERLILLWKNIDIGDEKGILDVAVTIELPEKSSLCFWRIFVDNRSRAYGLWEIHFPLFSSLGKSKEVDVAVPRSNWGFLYRNLEESVSGYYPSCDWPMQFLSINRGDNGLYLACHDPQAWTKSFFYKPGSEFYFNVRAENMGVAGSDFKSFPYAIGVYKGNWIKACKLYREWAVKNAPWTKKGPLARRKDTPVIIKNLGLWMLGGGTKDEVVPAMLKAKEFFQVPIGIHWYNWHQIGFDTEYPNYFPYKPGFPEGVRELTSRGIVAMPYINGRLWDSSLDSFKKEAVFWATKQPNGEPYIEVYNPQVKHAVMCPYTKFWQDKVNQIVERLIKECGVNAIYIDQIGAAGSVLCFDKNHGHPLGGGGYWVSGYRELLKRVKEKCAGKVAITTENNAEPYMDGVDAFLIWNPRHPAEVPMMTAVYSGYTIYFSSPTHGFSDTISFAMVQGRDFIWGCQLGWMGFELLSPEHKEKGDFLKTLAKYRMEVLKFILYGELLGEITPINEIPKVQGTWFQWGGGTIPAELPSVMGTYWKTEDGTLGALIVNVSDKEQVFSFPYPKELLPKGKKIIVNDVTPQGKQAFLFSGSSITLSLAPLSVKVLEFQPIDRKEKGKVSPAYEYIYANKLEWDFTTDKKEVTEGEEYNLIFRAKAGKPLKLSFKLEEEDFTLNLDGKKERIIKISRITPTAHNVAYISARGTLRFGNYETEVVVPIKVLPKFDLTLSSGIFRAGENGELKVSIQNNSSKSTSTRLFLQFPTEWDIEPASSLEVNLPPKEKGEFLFQINIPSQFAFSEAKVKAYIGEHQAILTVKILPPSPIVDCHYFKPQNGELLTLRNSFEPLLWDSRGVKVANWRGEEDLSGKAWIGWDEDNFYFIAEIRDDIFHQPYFGKDIWKGDCIQLAFRPAGVADYTTYEGVYEFGIALGPSGEEVYQWTPQEKRVQTTFCRIERKNNLTLYQLALPWKMIGLKTPKAGLVIGWAFTINDNDGEDFRGWVEWAGGICGVKDASLFGKLILKNTKQGGYKV